LEWPQEGILLGTLYKNRSTSNSSLVDGMLKVTTKGGKTYEGEIFAVDPMTNSMVLKRENVFSIINPSQIHHIDGQPVLPQDPTFTQFAVRYVSACVRAFV
jgi:hypothetical protein